MLLNKIKAFDQIHKLYVSIAYTIGMQLLVFLKTTNTNNSDHTITPKKK